MTQGLGGSLRRVSPGRFYPLGATLQAGGVNFAIYSKNATGVELLLFDQSESLPTEVIAFERRTRFVWHAFVHDIRAGQLYGYRVRGPFEPERGLRFNPHKLLVDPYAKALFGVARNLDNGLLGYAAQAPERDLSLDTRENYALVPKSVVVDDYFEWQDDAPPQVPFERTIIYEAHLKGFTADPSSGTRWPGTYRGLIDKIPHLKELGITTLELLPVHAHSSEDFLLERGLTNYWGYNTLGFFAPEPTFASSNEPGAAVREFKELVRALHREHIEVILDVVFNHIAEGSELGPTLSLRGIDNPEYYALTGPTAAPGRYYMNPTGCGNALDASKPAVVRLILDSLRYWVEKMHVDGFRFDLASVLGRQDGQFQASNVFFDTIAQDPLLSRVKLIAEPWDLATYQLGNFPVDWAEWNGRFRDTVRRFEKGERGQLQELGYRLTGSSDLYADDGRSPYNSINFVTCHDGFTLRDLVSYNTKHNQANLEGNRDGSDDNLSWNSGREGTLDADLEDPAIRKLRLQRVKNLICYLLFSAGTPMILAGDELFRSQGGNNNAYCQDNELSWISWRETRIQGEIFEFFKKAIAFRKRHTALQRRRFFGGKDYDGNQVPDIAWFDRELATPAWTDPELRTLAYQIDGRDAPDRPANYFLLFIANADWGEQLQRLPKPAGTTPWRRVVDTSLSAGADFAKRGDELELSDVAYYRVAPRSFVVLRA